MEDKKEDKQKRQNDVEWFIQYVAKLKAKNSAKKKKR